MLVKLKDICKQNCYKQVDADLLGNLREENSKDVKLLPSSKNYNWFTSINKGSNYVCYGEVITLGKARYANIKYWNGLFISANNNIIESANKEVLITKYLYYFLTKTAKEYYVESTSYPKFDQTIFDNQTVDLPVIDEQNKRTNILDKITSRIEFEEKNIEKYNTLIKSRFIEMFGSIQSMSLSTITIKDVAQINPKKEMLDDELEITFLPMEKVSVNGDIDTSEIRKYKDIKKGFSQIKENDVLLAKITPCMENGKATIARGLKNKYGCSTTELVNIRCNEMVNPEYIFTIIHSEYFRKLAKISMRGAVGQQRVPKEFIESFPINVPTIELQNEFAAFVELINKLKFSFLIPPQNCNRVKIGTPS